MFNNLTAPPSSTQSSISPAPVGGGLHQQPPPPQTDIYALLSTDDAVHLDDDDANIDTEALVMNMFDTSFPDNKHSSASANGSNNQSFPTPPPAVSNSTAKQFSFDQDFLNLDLTRSQPSHQQVQEAQSQQPQYTPSSEISIDSLFSLNYQPEPNPVFSTPFASNNIDFTRRHSVAVSGGIADFNLRNLSQNMTFNQHLQAHQPPPQQQQQQPQQRYPSHPAQQTFNNQQPPPIFARKTHQHLATVVEGEAPTPVPNMSHRASMPNIFLSEESRRRLTSSIQQRVESLSARTTPSNTPPPVSINFNQMPWSTPTNTTNATESRSNTNSPSQQFQDWNRNQEFLSPVPTPAAEDRPLVGRKRFYSQQFDSFPTNNVSAAMNVPFNAAPAFGHQLQQQQSQQQISSNLCPLPMSGIMSRRASVATPHDISTWNRMVDSNDRITLDQQQERKRQKQVPLARNEDTSKDAFLYQQMGHQHHQHEVAVKQEEYADKSENTSLNGSVTAVEEATPTKAPATSEEEDYPVITEADLEAAKKDANAIPRRQKLRYEGDEYTPKWVRYTGQLKEGYCDTCKPGKWLQLKNSAFWYHKQFFHGISSVSGKPFQRPLEQRAGEHDVIEGLCHQCKQFVPICNSKRKNSVLWYRHAHKCHIYDKPKPKGGKRASISVGSSNKKFNTTDQLQKIY
ncbi:DNA-dependent ATPase fun30 [Mucor velutinosus]|uniref:DNA-dependent ATPase fun30 n=1 Tax=Mucor velutinosus TaxID=708070 RepID=A0AAN7D808_9FUNG|nr:DNA-dependent ATPase fun30 [Mucor velutinosus]